ncbi:MAG: prepilin peptidase [Rickettsiales bacterium]|nr:prepilin peptidase [Rickettsiales bacterium]
MEQTFGIIIAAIFGAIFGSYATLFAHRLPIGESCFGRYFGNKSQCPKCNSTIRTRELIPLINWLFTLGKCRNCQAKIPRAHLFIELTTTVLFILSYLKFGFTEQFILATLIAVPCIILIVTDFKHKVFPYQLLNFLVTIGLASRVLVDHSIIETVYSASVGIICATIFYQIFYKRNPRLFATQEQSFDYTKFILIAAVCLNIPDFLLYFSLVMIIFTTMLLFDVPDNKIRFSFGYSIIIPFLWLFLA